MVKEIRWTKYFCLSILSFGAFMLEYLSILIEVILLHVDIQNYTAQQRSIHYIIMVFMWAVFIGCKILTFIDWHTLKVIGEAQGKKRLKLF